MARLNYLELPTADVRAAKDFYEAAFGLDFVDFGPTYAATMSGDTDIGFQGDRSEQSAGPLAVIEVEDLEASLAAVIAAGGEITRPIFGFPGGRRFQFRDRDGHEIGVVTPDGH